LPVNDTISALSSGRVLDYKFPRIPLEGDLSASLTALVVLCVLAGENVDIDCDLGALCGVNRVLLTIFI